MAEWAGCSHECFLFMRRRSLILSLGLMPIASRAGQQSDLRTPAEVAQRVLALMAVSFAAKDLVGARAWVKKHALEAVLSPKERGFIQAATRDHKQVVQLSWRIEGTAPLLWALGRISKMPSFSEQLSLDHGPLLRSIIDDPALLMRSLKLRSSDEIWSAQAQALSAHWKIRDASLNRRPIPFGLDPDLITERHHALNWLVRDGAKEWDDVETNT
ncbi:MAG: DUF4272 domain-containing protein [Ideonella sp.]